MAKKVVKKSPYEEILHWSALKVCQEAREAAYTAIKLSKIPVEQICAELELPESKVKHWIDYKKKLVLSKAPRDRDLMVLLLRLGYTVSVSIKKAN